jgi:RNA polymerase sigma-70 factor (ECF subfamily)
MPNFISDEELKDDQLRMIFTCCHPGIPEESQIALTLKILCGFGIGEIARAFLSKEPTIAKRLTRARKKISELKIPYEVPAGKELTNRLESVLKVLYLLFNEGYSPSSGDKPIRPDLCSEAIRLAKLLSDNPAIKSPQCHALLALMLLNASRFPARVDRDGNLLLLKEQNRTLWDREMISEGLFHLRKSVGSEVVTEYHLQAAISACHSIAESYESTDWKQILSLYNAYSKLNRSPIVALNRAIAVSKVHGPKAGIDEINKINDLKALESYHLLYSVLGDLNLQLGNYEEALNNYQNALKLSKVKAEQSFYRRRIKSCQQKLDIADKYRLAKSF